MNQIYEKNIPWDLIGKCLSGNASVQENSSLQLWLNEKKEHKKTFEELKLIWDKSLSETSVSGNLTSAETDAAWNKLQKRIATKPQGAKKLVLWTRKTAMVAAAAVLGLMLISYWLLPQALGWNNVESQEDWLAVVNDNAEPKTVQMPDGTSIILNKNATLRYPAKFDKRKVALEGEALFKVAHNPKSPFSVKAGETNIEVLGTTFNVNADKNKPDVTVMVQSGQVKFSAPNKESMLLGTGKGAVYNSNTEKLTAKNNLNAAAWQSNHLQFQNTKIGEIIETLQSLYNIKIEVNNPDLLNCEFSGSYDKVLPEVILQAIRFSLDIDLSFENDTYYLKGAGCKK